MLVPGLYLTNGLPRGEELLLFFPGLRRRACQEDVEASGPPAVPCGVADRRQQLLGHWGARALYRAPLPGPLPAAPPDLSTHPTMTLGLPLPGAKGQAAGPPWAR